jgi:hypothetical protein
MITTEEKHPTIAEDKMFPFLMLLNSWVRVNHFKHELVIKDNKLIFSFLICDFDQWPEL